MPVNPVATGGEILETTKKINQQSLHEVERGI
jgi:hypothetical protein